MSDEERPETTTKESNVRDLVQQLKSGRKNKSEAFLELQHLLKSQATSNERSMVEDDDTGTQSTSTGAARFSKEDRRLLITKLIEKKRQNRSQETDEIMQNEVFGSYQEEEFPGDVEHGDSSEWQQSQDVVSQEIYPEHPSSYVDPYAGTYSTQQRSQSAPRSRPAPPPMPSYKLRDDTNIQIRQRTHKIAVSEANIRAEMFKECTFHPTIRPLPNSYGGLKEKDSPFLTRVSRWQLQKNLESSRRKQMHDSAEMQDCTFKPYINKNSQRSAKLNQATNVAANERLYESYSFIESNKAKHAEDEKARQRQKEDELCTFAPKVNKHKFNYVTSRYDKPKTPPATGAAPGSPGERSATTDRLTPKECTFTPKIRGVKKSMASAQLYVSTNVVDRLTKPIAPQSSDNKDSGVFFDDFGDRAVMDVASFMGTLGRGRSSGGSVASSSRGRSLSRERTGPPKRRSSSAPRAGGRDKSAERASSAEREQSFAQFLGRQSQTQLRRQKKVQEVSQQIKPSFTPNLNRRSLSIVNTTRRGEFLDRYERDLQRRDNTEKTLLNATVDPDCSFHPQLTARASKQRSRSVYEMSRGDLHKKQTNQKILKLRTEQEELQNMTFQPQISEFAATKARSVLKLNENPGGFLERYKLTQQQQDAERQRYNAAKQSEELKDCTFTPATKDCPAYIKRIARSLAVVKSVRTSTDEAPSRPQWK